MNWRTDLAAGLALTVALAGGLSAWLDRPGSVDVPAGRSDSGAYVVQALRAGDGEPIRTGDGETLVPVARFETRGRVLHIERFKPYQSLSNWVPGLRPSTHDIGLGYGPMTDTANVELYSYRHDGATGGTRYLGWRPRNEAGARRMQELAPHITNVHVIPANAAIEAQIRRVRVGELLTLRGLLVNYRTRDGRLAATSMTAGDHECEIVWVTEVQVARLY